MAQRAEARLRAIELQHKALSGDVIAPPQDPRGDAALLARRRHTAKTPADESNLLRTRIEELTTERAETQAHITRLRQDLHVLAQQRDYVSNAYDGLKRKHDQVMAERANETDRVNELMHELEVSNESVKVWKARGERAEQEALTLREKFARIQTAMAD
jgi:chromosome segregation ATPase